MHGLGWTLPGILVVERSATLSHLLRRTLAAAQMEAQTEVSGYLEAIEHLHAQHNSGKPYALVLLGAPARMTREFSALLDVLRGGVALDVPLILMAHEKTPELTELATGRPKTSLMAWANFSRIPGSARALLPAATLGGSARSRQRSHNAIRILLVDDSQSMREAYRRIFERGGFDVTTADSIRQASAALERERFDIVIVDYFLPDGNGEELCRRLSGKADSPVLAIITGTYREEIIKRCIDAGASECLFKNEANELTLARVRTLARQIQSQKTVEAERQRLDGILGSVGDGVYGVDNDGVITFMNPTGLRLLDWPDEGALLGQSAHALIHPTLEDGRRVDPKDSVLTRAYTEGESLTSHETLFWTRGGDSMPTECSVLPLAIQQRREGSVIVFRDISGRKSAERLRWEATHDPLTGLLNLRELQSQLAEEIVRRRSSAGYAALLHVDIDRFSYIEDTIGAQQAERLIVEVAGAMAKLSRAGDVVARLDGDKFALLLVGVQLENLYSLADGFREVLHQCHYVAHGSRRNISVSIGVAVVSKDSPPIEQILDHARHACKVAKQRGRNQIEIYVGDADTRVAQAIAAGWTERLHSALNEGRFVLLVEPIVPMAALPLTEAEIVQRDGWRINGAQAAPETEYLFEVLIRMVGTDGRWISPRVFVPLAEQAGMMPKIDLWILQRLLRHIEAFKGVKRSIAFNLNLSNATLGDAHALAQVEEAVRSAGALAKRLIFEITETSQLVSVQRARAFISEMKKLGCRFALDDFGTGFSSFTHLRHLPVDLVKIEGSFVEGMVGSELDRKMVASITQLAHSFRLKVVGEHVNSFLTLAALRESGSDYAQGHYLGEPRQLAEIDFDTLFSRK